MKMDNPFDINITYADLLQGSVERKAVLLRQLISTISSYDLHGKKHQIDALINEIIEAENRLLILLKELEIEALKGEDIYSEQLELRL